MGLIWLPCNRRRGEHGLNEIKGKGPDPLWKKYLEQVCPNFINTTFETNLVTLLVFSDSSGTPSSRSS